MLDWINTYCIYHMKNGDKQYYNYYTPTKQAIDQIDYRLSWDKDIKVVEFITKQEFYHHWGYIVYPSPLSQIEMCLQSVVKIILHT